MVSGHHCKDAVEILIVAESRCDRRRIRRIRVGAVFYCEITEIFLLDCIQIAEDSLGPERHCAVDIGADRRRPAAFEIAAVAGRNFDREADIMGLQSLLQIPLVGDRGLFCEIV